MDIVFTEKIKIATRSCQFHFQGIIHYELLEALSANIFYLQQKGVLVDLIILMDGITKSIKTTHTLIRLSAGGGQIFCYNKIFELSNIFLLIDKAIIIKPSSTGEGIEMDYQTKLTSSIVKYKALIENSEPIIHQSGWPNIVFRASQEWVKKGGDVELFWEVDSAQSILLLPLNISIPPKGNYTIQMEDDCVFSIQAQNENIMAEKRIFIKALTHVGIEFSVQISMNEGPEFLPLKSHPEIPFHYAIPPKCLIKLLWESDRMGILKEKEWGEIPNNGSRDIQFDADTILTFSWKTIFDKQDISIHFYVLNENDSQPNEKKEMNNKKFLGLFKQRRG